MASRSHSSHVTDVHPHTHTLTHTSVKSLEQEVQRLQRRASSRSLLKRTGSSADEPAKTPVSVVVKVGRHP